MPLPKFYRFRILWEADQTLAYTAGARVTIDVQTWKFTSAGALEYGTLIEDDFGFDTNGETIVDDGQEESAVYDNATTRKDLGFKGTLKVIADANSTDGTMTLFVEESDLDSKWPSDLADFDIQDLFPICVLSMSTDAEDEGRAKTFSYE